MTLTQRQRSSAGSQNAGFSREVVCCRGLLSSAKCSGEHLRALEEKKCCAITAWCGPGCQFFIQVSERRQASGGRILSSSVCRRVNARAGCAASIAATRGPEWAKLTSMPPPSGNRYW